MKKLKLNNETIEIRTELDELTYSETVLFQQNILRVLYNIDLENFATLMTDIKQLFNEGKFAEMLIRLENFYTGLRLQEPGVDGWIICFGILVAKNETELNEFKLAEIVRDLERKGLKKSQIKEEVENFTLAFPLISSLLKIRAEGLTALTEEILSKLLN